MARTSRRGLDYFPMDIDMFYDLKIRKLIKYQGGKSITIYALLLCNIYKNGYYMEWDDELPFICSELTGFDEAYVSEVIKACLALGLFSKELFDADKILTSKSIQERYSRICMQSRRVCNIPDYNLIAQQRSITPMPPLLLEQEIEKLKQDEVWLDGLQVLHSLDITQLRNKLDDFHALCMADGKEQGHQSIADAKKHFNSWLRIINKNKDNKDDKDRSRRKNQRRGNILAPDEAKTYGNSF